MKERILGYRNRIDKLLEKNDKATDWKKVLEEHLVQISFFQHERFVHLIVTVTFALMELIAMGIFLCTENISVLLLCAVIFVLLIPYIVHYYLLENETQKMYTQYDKILENIDLMREDN
ncbi:MAG: hypothetical protein K2M73_09435 [Lachnospiraceae bacterium]|nr:hypothetical protein [Lachnospiraceae bacterium]